jgi:hypothetical protein
LGNFCGGLQAQAVRSDSEALRRNRYRSIKISPKKILHGVLNPGFPQPDYFPSRKFCTMFSIPVFPNLIIFP